MKNEIQTTAADKYYTDDAGETYQCIYIPNTWGAFKNLENRLYETTKGEYAFGDNVRFPNVEINLLQRSIVAKGKIGDWILFHKNKPVAIFDEIYLKNNFKQILSKPNLTITDLLIIGFKLHSTNYLTYIFPHNHRMAYFYIEVEKINKGITSKELISLLIKHVVEEMQDQFNQEKAGQEL